MNSTALERLRERLAPLIEEAAQAIRAEAEEREAAIARALEAAQEAPATRTAYQQGRYDREREILALIAEQTDILERSGVHAITLETLSRRITGAVA